MFSLPGWIGPVARADDTRESSAKYLEYVLDSSASEELPGAAPSLYSMLGCSCLPDAEHQETLHNFLHKQNCKTYTLPVMLIRSLFISLLHTVRCDFYFFNLPR